jgi:branched-chain amino acid transport system substrate-binding protein
MRYFSYGGHSYDAMMLLLVKAIESAGTDREKVRESLENITGYYGTAGEFNLSPEDHNGLDINAFAMLTVRKGQFELLKK